MEAVAAANNILIDEDEPQAGCVHIRVGFHSGPVVSNVIGSLNPRYGLFGDTMNTAARMEGLSTRDGIQCSEASARLLKEQAPDFPLRRRGRIAVKGKGQMMTYWVGNPPVRAEAEGESFDRKTALVSFKTEGGERKKSQVFKARRALRMKMSGEVESLEGSDPSNSAPIPLSKPRLKSMGSSIMSQ